ncbi:glycoside hydrolase family 30 beta sandwich domain-containing protein [Prevotella sp. 10(H)]|uniref:glycoside hydrolase family 30 protein n=1 Tax=Prevotella sp. 10(H) TaxID=1158294 RepID=UPI0004A75DE8|nr:glycoside hydrolase family 30 protein [Prevotella sp. 10(H)]
MKTRYAVFITCMMYVLSTHAQQIEWFSSTNESRWQQEKKVKIENKRSDVKYDIEISDDKAQLFEGFGGCFNEMGWDALMALDETERNKITDDLFSPKGANFNYNRMPMGASDYGLNFYSFNDVADDLKMINFNINRDRYILIPFIRTAQKANPNFRIWGSPWSPPAWMKTNNHYASNIYENEKDLNGLPRERILELPTTGFKMQKGYLEAYALYFVKYIQAYAKEGIKVEAVHVQNEPCSNHKFPSCTWRPEDIAYFIGEFLGPKFEQEKVDADIYFGTINRNNPDYTRAALKDEKAAKYIKGVGFQWDGKYAIPTIHKEYPHLKLMQTESECGNGENNWGSAEYTWGLISHYLRNGANTYAYWNMVLDHTGVSTWGWKQNTLISVNKETKEVTYNPEYYIMKHVSHYVMPGAYRLEASEGNDHLAFLNPDGKIIIIAVNRDDTDKKIAVSVKDKAININLKAKSFNTFALSIN